MAKDKLLTKCVVRENTDLLDGETEQSQILPE